MSTEYASPPPGRFNGDNPFLIVSSQSDEPFAIDIGAYCRQRVDIADGWSSMTGFALIVFMEDTFAVSIDPDVFSEMNTLQELYSLVESSEKVRQTSC